MTDDQPLSDRQKFALDKSSATLFEAGKEASRCFFIFVMLLSSTIVIIFAASTSEDIPIPVVGLKLRPVYAAEIFLILAVAYFCQYFTLLFSEMILRKKYERLLAASGMPAVEWYSRYPSFAHFHGIMAPSLSKNVQRLAGVFQLITIGMGFVLPIYLEYRIRRILGSWSLHFFIGAFVIAFFIISSIILFKEMKAVNFEKVFTDLDREPAELQR